MNDYPALRTGAEFRQFVLRLLDQKNAPDAGPSPALDEYLSALWHLTQPHQHLRQFAYGQLAEWLAAAFTAPPRPYDWAAELRRPYAPVLYSTFPERTPEFRRELVSYARLERQLHDQLLILKRLDAQKPLPADLTWENRTVDTFLERATVYLEEDDDPETALDWSDLGSLLSRGQWNE